MAGSPADVLTFVRDLARRARPFADKELAELGRFAREHLGLSELQAWDRAFVSEKLKQAHYAFSSEEVRQYFTEPRVLRGLLICPWAGTAATKARRFGAKRRR